MDRRIFGLETEYGVACTSGGARRLTPDEVARYLFRRVVTWGRSSNVFLRNGSRIYLDVGSHPEYATAECDDLIQLINHDRAGERILEDLIVDAEQRLSSEGITGDIYLFKNNTDSSRQLLRLPRELPDLPGRRVRQDHRRARAVPGLPAVDLRGREDPAHRSRRGVQREPARRAHLGVGVLGDDPQPADHQHPRRATCRPGALSPAARHRRRLEHVRDDDAAQGRQRRAGAAADRGRRADARLQPGQPDPGDPRHESGPDRSGPGVAGQRQEDLGARAADRVLREGLGVRRPRRVWARRASTGCWICGSEPCGRWPRTNSAW